MAKANVEERQKARKVNNHSEGAEGRKMDSLGRMQSPTSAQAGKANMMPLDQMDKTDPERAKAIRRKGQAAQMAKARQRKAIREIYEELLAQKVPDSVTNEAVARYAEETGKRASRPTSALLLRSCWRPRRETPKRRPLCVIAWVTSLWSKSMFPRA